LAAFPAALFGAKKLVPAQRVINWAADPPGSLLPVSGVQIARGREVSDCYFFRYDHSLAKWMSAPPHYERSITVVDPDGTRRTVKINEGL
jgi:hypothetical protein